MQDDNAFSQALRLKLQEYATAVNSAELSAASRAMYIDMATCFVRWTEGMFTPGGLKIEARPRMSRTSSIRKPQGT